MRLVHISDLHIGKRLIERSLLEDQKYILKKIETIIYKENFDGVLIAGDIYDKAVPSSEAVELFNDFLTNLAKHDIKVFMISGNHDSAERIGFGSFMMSKAGVYVSPSYNGEIKVATLNDEYGDVNIYLLPFIKPAYVKSYYPDADIETYTDALKFVIEKMNVDKSKRNILLAHQFVGHAQKDGSEEASIGGLDVVDDNIFDDFDYVALGHIHKKQTLKGKIRYCGTPLQYSFSENKNINSLTVVELKQKGDLKISEIELEAKRKLIQIKGTFEELTSEEFYKDLNRDDYYGVTLTNEDDVVDGANKLRAIYPNMLKLEYDNKRTNAARTITTIDGLEDKSTLDLFKEFYEKLNGKQMSKEEEKYMDKAIRDVEEGE